MPRGESEPLLPRHESESISKEQKLRRKLRTYQMLRAFTDGYMPSTEQTIANLQAVLASEALSNYTPDISNDGRKFIYDSRRWIRALIDILREKNSEDQLQDFLWRVCRHSPGPLGRRRTGGTDFKACAFSLSFVAIECEN